MDERLSYSPQSVGELMASAPTPVDLFPAAVSRRFGAPPHRYRTAGAACHCERGQLAGSKCGDSALFMLLAKNIP